MDFPKISGNSNALFDLIDINEPQNGLDINNINQEGVFTAVFTDTADLHTEAYLFFIIKNTVPVSDANTNLSLNSISIFPVIDGVTSDTAVWSTNGVDVIHDTNGPIECDYVLTGTNQLFVGIEDGAGNIATGDIATHVLTDSDSSLNSITSSNDFVKFKVENGPEGLGILKIDDAGSSTHIHQLPLYTAKELCSASNGGIPNHSYAAFPVRVSIDDVSAFSQLSFKLVVSHDGTVGTGENADSSAIEIPITIVATNLMQCQVFVGDTLKATNNATGNGGTLISRMNKIPPVAGASDGITALNYGFAEGSANPSLTTNFATFDIAEQYASGGENITENLHLTRTAFNSGAEQVTWKETSAVKSPNKSLTITHIDPNDSTIISNLKTPFDINNEILDINQNEKVISFEQTPAGTGISTIEKQRSDLGGYENFTISQATSPITVTFNTRGGTQAENINTLLDINFVKYPVMSMSSFTKNKLVNSDYTEGNVFGVNTSFTGTGSIDTSPIHHDHADTENSTIHTCLGTTGTVSHFVPGTPKNYVGSQDIQVDSYFISNSSTTTVEVTLNSFQVSDNPLFNGITSFGNPGITKGQGFADIGCVVEQASIGQASSLPAFGAGSPDNADGANNQITTVISDSGHRDYAVRLETTSDVFRVYDVLNTDFIDYNNQIQGFGAERYKIGISMPTGLIDYGFGLTPNHANFSEKAQIAFAQYPALPDLHVFAFDGAPIDSSVITAANQIGHTIETKWSKLTVLPNTATGAVSSSRGGASDGLYDWAKDTSSDNTNKHTFKMVSTYNAEISNGSHLVDLEIHEQLVVNGAVSLNATTITVGTAGFLQEGMRLIEQKGGSNTSQNTSNTALFAATPYIVSDITGTTVTIVKDLGYAANGTSNVVTTNVLPAIDSGVDLVFIDDWTQVGMLVEHDNLVETGKEYSIAEITYVGGTQAGNQFSLATFPAALQAGATKVKLRLLHKRIPAGGVATNGVATGDSTDKKLTFLKPHENFTEVDAGVNLKYEIQNQPLNRAKIGEKVRVKSGTGSFAAVTEFTTTPNVGDETIVTGLTSSIPSSTATCDIIVEKRGGKNVFEPGVTKADGSALLSKKNAGNGSINASYYASMAPSSGLILWQMPATEVGGGVYFKEFTIALVNFGEEDLYWARASFVDATWVRFKDAKGLVYETQPEDAIGVNWQVCNFGDTSFTNQVTSPIYSSTSNLVNTPTQMLNLVDGRVQKGSFGGSGINNVIGCRFEVQIGAGISGSYYKYLKVEYVRDTGRTKHFFDGSNVVERPFKDKEVYQALIPVLITLDAAGQIEMQDVDGTSITTGTTITIDGLIA